VSLPVPLPGSVIVIHDDALLATVHAQPVGTDTLNVPLVACAETDALVGESVRVQGAAACEIAKV
jgi:hypothetical protein